jgi:hypothetical protein
MKSKKDKIIKKWGYKKEDLPFTDIEIYNDEETSVENKYSGASIKLNPVELAIYDVLMGAYHLHLQIFKNEPDIAREMYADFNLGKNWFIENNPDAYFTLID